MIREGNYILIPAFARTELDLKGHELILYSIIYGFSQDERSEFAGSVEYLCEWCGISRSTCIRAIKSLVERGFIVKINTETETGATSVNKYKAVYGGGVKMTPQGVKMEPYGGVKMTPNNIYNNNNNNIYISTPSLTEIREYVVNNGYSVDPSYFFSYYEAKGWMLGNSPMVDWKATLDSWETLQYRRDTNA